MKTDTTNPPLLRTKLHRPPVTAETVRRKRLHELMDRALELPLTLVSAPAGYGKSMLVSHWAESLDTTPAWLSLDPNDSDLKLFLRYFLAAVETVLPDACPETRALSTSPNPVPLPVLGGCLVNELDTADSPLVLVLDDYHRIDPMSDVHELLQFLLEQTLPMLRLVLVTRSDPPFLIASLRGRGRLTEIRLRDLQFTASETSEYLERSSELKVSEEALESLEQQTEGWIVALRLISLHLQQIDDPEAFLKSLHGGIQHTREYLLLEVLARLPSRTLDCMLRTAILDRFCPELCEAVWATAVDSEKPDPDGRHFVETLSASNLFIIPLDAQGNWFRFHHLFQEMLHDQLETRASPREIATLHLRASEWFEGEGLITESIEHALAAGDPEHAAGVVERHRTAELDEDRWYVVRKWLDLLPEACTQQHAGLLLAEAWILYEQFQLQTIPVILDRVGPLLEGKSADQALVGELQFFRGALHYWEGRGEESRRGIQEARVRLPEARGLAGGLLGLYVGITDCMNGHKDQAVRTLNALVQETGSLEGIYDSRLIAGLYFVRHLSGDLGQAEGEARRLQVVAEKSDIAYTKAWSWYMQACARMHRHDLAGALDLFAAVVRQRYILHTRAALDALAGLAISQQLTRQMDEAAETVSMLREFALRLDDPQCLSVADSCRARVSLLRGDVTEPMQWARSFGEPPVVSELFMWLEVPWITRARVLIAGGTGEALTDALDLLAAIRRQSEACRFTCQTIEVVVLQSLALERRGRADEALECLREALALAGPGGWIRPFVEAGPPMGKLLGRLPAQDSDAAFVQQILSAATEAGRSVDPGPQQAQQPPVDLLTDREQEILELLAQRLQYKEIAAQLFISPQTVNSHLKNVYQKLGVSSRRQAVARASKLGLLSST